MAVKTLRAVLYFRVSTEEQAQSGAGVGSQRDQCEAHAKRHGWKVLASHADDGVSGSIPPGDRPGLRAAVGALSPGDVLLVARRDRIGRDRLAVGAFEAAVVAHGCRIVSVAGEGTEGDSSNDILLRAIIDAIAENGRLVGKERTRDALANRRKEGRRSGQLRYGEKLTGSGPLSKRDKLPTGLEVDLGDVEVLRLIAQWDREGWSLRAIARELQARGFPTKNAGKGKAVGVWNPSTVYRLAKRIRDEAEAAAG